MFTELRVHMDCAGCVTKIKKALQKLDGVDDIDIDIAMQKVTVMGWANQKKVLKAVRKTGRRAELWPYPYNPEYYNFNQHYYYQQQQQQQRSEPSTYFAAQNRSSSYNYRKHGYNSEEYGYYQTPPHSIPFDEHATSLFSDENPHACSTM